MTKIKTIDLETIKQELEKANSKLFKECGLFFAFSKEQFEANKTPLKEGEKYVHVIGGGYVPKNNFEMLKAGMEANFKAYNEAVKSNNLLRKQIAYEFGNHECFYTGDWSVVASMFPEVKPEVIHRIYKAEYKKHVQWCKKTEN